MELKGKSSDRRWCEAIELAIGSSIAEQWRGKFRSPRFELDLYQNLEPPLESSLLAQEEKLMELAVLVRE